MKHFLFLLVLFILIAFSSCGEMKTHVYEVYQNDVNGTTFVFKDGEIFNGILYSSNERMSADISNGRFTRSMTLYHSNGSIAISDNAYYDESGNSISSDEFLKKYSHYESVVNSCEHEFDFLK